MTYVKERERLTIEKLAADSVGACAGTMDGDSTFLIPRYSSTRAKYSGVSGTKSLLLLAAVERLRTKQAHLL
jgi:hypothetical protein